MRQTTCAPWYSAWDCRECRTTHFFASADKAKAKLGWYPEHNFLMDVGELVEAYKASGRLNKEIDFSTDDKILASVRH